MVIATNPDYWDCECKVNFIHAKTDTLECRLCQSTHEDQPDSRVSEIRISDESIFLMMAVNVFSFIGDPAYQTILKLSPENLDALAHFATILADTKRRAPEVN